MENLYYYVAELHHKYDEIGIGIFSSLEKANEAVNARVVSMFPAFLNVTILLMPMEYRDNEGNERVLYYASEPIGNGKYYMVKPYQLDVTNERN